MTEDEVKVADSSRVRLPFGIRIVGFGPGLLRVFLGGCFGLLLAKLLCLVSGFGRAGFQGLIGLLARAAPVDNKSQDSVGESVLTQLVVTGAVSL